MQLTEDEIANAKSTLNELTVEHRDLNLIIEHLAATPLPDQDQLLIQRLKKRKLLLKDKIFQLEGMLVPDIRTGGSDRPGAVASKDKTAEIPEQCGDHRAAGDRQYPCPNDRPRDPPAHSGQALRRADADDGAGDGVRCRHRDTERRGEKQSRSSTRLRAKTANRTQFGNPLPHQLNDPPAAKQRTNANRRIARNDDPHRHGIATL